MEEPAVKNSRGFKTEMAPSLEWSYSDFMTHVDKINDISSVVSDPLGRSVEVEDIYGVRRRVEMPADFMLSSLLDKNINISVRPDSTHESGKLSSIKMINESLSLIFQLFLIGMILSFIANRMAGSSAGDGMRGLTSQFGDESIKKSKKSKKPWWHFMHFMDFIKSIGGEASASEEDDENDDGEITFSKVAGLEGPKRELKEIVDFLLRPKEFARMGAELPKGVLLTGPAGTGKTLLAKAVAGEADVPFLYCSGSEFVQIFAGLGATRVRDLFKKAREKAPCIVFIDEIDAIGRARSTHAGNGANTEQEQTMNQLLTELDGFKSATGIVVVAATNRKDILDEALIRSGRFDRHVVVGVPSKEERRAILEVHLRGKKIDSSVNPATLAGLTQGMVGADLKNLVNEAAIYAVQHSEPWITMEGFQKSLDKMWLGLENTTIVMSAAQRELVAYHEAGHALMGIVVNEYDRLERITIVPRGDAGGLTVFQEDDQDIQLYSQQYLLNRLIVALGGRMAEKKVYGSLRTTTGASADLENVQHIARKMVSELGFNETLGQASWSDDFGISGSTTEAIDAEVKYLVEWAQGETQNLIEHYEFYLHRLAEGLLEKKTLFQEDILKCVEGITCELEMSPKQKQQIAAAEEAAAAQKSMKKNRRRRKYRYVDASVDMSADASADAMTIATDISALTILYPEAFMP
jgi:cell division protease FtsH